MRDTWYEFINTIPREDFYDFYSVMTAMAEPLCGDIIYQPDGAPHARRYNLKKVIRRIRITVMGERFKVDYARAYAKYELEHDLQDLTILRLGLRDFVEKKAVDKLISALKAMLKLRLFEEEKR